MKNRPIFTNSTEIYDLLKPLGYDVVFGELPPIKHGPGFRVIIDEMNDWIEARGGWPKVPKYQSERWRKTITVWSGFRGGGMTLSKAKFTRLYFALSNVGNVVNELGK